MYYHHRELDYVRYAKVGPAPLDRLDADFARAYRWLGHYCGFCPQIWLSRSRSRITGFRPWQPGQQPPPYGVLFGFESVQGFPVAYAFWCRLLGTLWNHENLVHTNKAIENYLDWLASDMDDCSDSDYPSDPFVLTWRKTRDLQAVFSKHLFVKHDQVVVPNLNLKAAKVIICRNERQKRALRRMGFIEDRLVIRPWQPAR